MVECQSQACSTHRLVALKDETVIKIVDSYLVSLIINKLFYTNLDDKGSMVAVFYSSFSKQYLSVKSIDLPALKYSV